MLDGNLVVFNGKNITQAAKKCFCKMKLSGVFSGHLYNRIKIVSAFRKAPQLLVEKFLRDDL